MYFSIISLLLFISLPLSSYAMLDDQEAESSNRNGVNIKVIPEGEIVSDGWGSKLKGKFRVEVAVEKPEKPGPEKPAKAEKPAKPAKPEKAEKPAKPVKTETECILN